MMRILLFLATNLAVVLVASITLRLLGVEPYLNANGLNMNSLLIFCFVIGMAGSLVSLFISKWMAKMSTKAKVIEQPGNATERWLLDTVGELARDAGIKMPEVAIFPAQQSNAFATGWNKNDALVAVSAGLLERMRPEEIRAVLAHEIGHVANGDMVTLALIQGVLNSPTPSPRAGTRTMPWSRFPPACSNACVPRKSARYWRTRSATSPTATWSPWRSSRGFSTPS